LCLFAGGHLRPIFLPHTRPCSFKPRVTSLSTVTKSSDAIVRSPDARIALIGEALVDHFPDAKVVGGAPFNVARNLAALGASPLLITCVGSDDDAVSILGEFARFGMSAHGVQRDATRPTGNVQVTLTGGQPAYTIAPAQAWDAIDLAAAQHSIEAFSPAALCYGTLAQRESGSRRTIREIVARSARLRVLDLNLRNTAYDQEISHWSLQHADVVKLNDEELGQLLLWFGPQGSTPIRWESDGLIALGVAVRALAQVFGFQQLIVTRGAKGYCAFDANGTMVAGGRAPRVTVTDTVGAGDAFLAITMLGQQWQWPLQTTLEEAAAFAAAVCTLRGAVSRDPAFYQPWRERFMAIARVPSTETLAPRRVLS
jgi:fructokinase